MNELLNNRSSVRLLTVGSCSSLRQTRENCLRPQDLKAEGLQRVNFPWHYLDPSRVKISKVSIESKCELDKASVTVSALLDE